MKKIVVLISGSGSNLEAIIESCAAKKINGKVIHVISNNPDAFGLSRASKFNIASKVINHKKFSSRIDFENSLEEFLDTLNADLIVLAGFMRILGTKITSKFSNKMINLHPSLLPKYKGLNTHNRAIQNKDKYSGATVHIVNEKLDSGKIILQKKVKIVKSDSGKSLEKKVLKIEHKIYSKAIIKLLASD